MGKTPPRFLVVSHGSIGQRHLRNLRELYPESEIGLLRLSNRTDTRVPENADCLLSSIDDAVRFHPRAAIIASPAPFHEGTACALATGGVHLLIEKPLAHDVGAAARIESAVKQAGVVCLVGYNLRFRKSLQMVRDMLLKGKVGRVVSVQAQAGQYLPTWRPAQDYRTGVSAQKELGGGALLELSHELDYLLWLFGMPDTLSCVMGHYSDLQIDVEDVVNLTMLYPGQRRAIGVRLDFLQQEPARNCTFIGTEGTMVWDAIADTVMVRRHDDDLQSMHGPFESGNDATYLAELEYFMDCIATGRTPDADAAQGARVLELVDAARLSDREGRIVRLMETAL